MNSVSPPKKLLEYNKSRAYRNSCLRKNSICPALDMVNVPGSTGILAQRDPQINDMRQEQLMLQRIGCRYIEYQFEARRIFLDDERCNGWKRFNCILKGMQTLLTSRQ